MQATQTHKTVHLKKTKSINHINNNQVKSKQTASKSAQTKNLNQKPAHATQKQST